MELITKLQQIGLSRREAEVYIALLQKKEFTAPELTKMTTITRTKIYEILQNLIRKGICNENYKDGNKIFRAVKPKIALQNVIANYELEIEQKQQEILQKKKAEIEQKKKVAVSLEEELEEIHSNNLQKVDNLDYIEIIRDKNEIRNKFLNLQKSAKNEMLVFNKAPYSITPAENLKDETEVINKGIKYKGIYEYADIKSVSDMNQFINLLSTYSSIGEDLRVIEKLPIKLAVIDKKITMLALNDPVSMKPSITTMVVSHSSFALAQKEVFESYWNKSFPFEDFKRNQNI